MNTRRRLSAALLACLAAPRAFAQSPAAAPAMRTDKWPDRPLHFIVPYTPGGFTDVTARLIAVKLGERLGQTVVVENKPGANSMIGVDAMAKAAPDGNTFAVVIAAYSANPALYPKRPYDEAKDIQAVSLIGIAPLVAAVNNDAPFRNAQELLAYAKANPNKINFGSSGTGAAAHLTTELLKSRAGIQMTHVPYRGTAPALNDLIGGQIQLLFDTPNALLPQGQAGKVRLIGVAHDKRLPQAPELPTFIEQGVADFTGATWAGLLAPAGVPAPIVKRVADEIAAIVKLDDVRAQFDKLGIQPVGSSPDEFKRFIAMETDKWGAVIREAGVKPE